MLIVIMSLGCKLGINILKLIKEVIVMFFILLLVIGCFSFMCFFFVFGFVVLVLYYEYFRF